MLLRLAQILLGALRVKLPELLHIKGDPRVSTEAGAPLLARKDLPQLVFQDKIQESGVFVEVLDKRLVRLEWDLGQVDRQERIRFPISILFAEQVDCQPFVDGVGAYGYGEFTVPIGTVKRRAFDVPLIPFPLPDAA